MNAYKNLDVLVQNANGLLQLRCPQVVFGLQRAGHLCDALLLNNIIVPV